MTIKPDSKITIRLFGRLLAGTEIDNVHFDRDPDDEAFQRMGQAASDAGIKHLYAPSVRDATARVCQPEDLEETMQLGKVSLHRGFNADGVVIPKGGGAWILTADCPTLILWSSEKCVAAHAGRDCSFDRALLDTGKPAREHASVVQACMAEFEGVPAGELKAFVTCHIAPEHFDHPWDHEQWGQANKRLTQAALELGSQCVSGDPEMGRLDLFQVIRAQLVRYGLDASNIGHDDIDTYLDTDEQGRHLWHSFRRERTEKHNGIFVVHEA